MVWIVCSYGDVGVLRVRKSQPLVYPGVRGGVRAWFGVRVSTRGLAIRIDRGCLVHCGGSAMADWRDTIPLNNCHYAFSLELRRLQLMVILNHE